MKQNVFRTVSDAWFELLNQALHQTYKQEISRGSFENEQIRHQFPFVTLTITKPLDDYVPCVPDGVAPPTTKEYVEHYFCDYIIGGKEPEGNELYTYASRIADQLPQVMEMLKHTPETNQASIIVGRPEDVNISDPACLRLIDFKVVGGKLDITTFWRSHDLWGGFPANLGAMGMLQEIVAEYTGVDSGYMHYASSGLHVYEYSIESLKAKMGITNEQSQYV